MLSNTDVASCDRCGQRIRWTVTAKGRPQAVDANPNDAGNTAVYADAVGRLRSRALTSERPALEHLEWRAMPHAATCKEPGRSRRAPQRHTTGVRPVRWQGWQGWQR
ncbi:hypothetical protein [Streptomyces chryseus]